MEKMVLLLLSMPILIVMPIIGFIISKWLNEEPKGLVKYDVMSNQVSQNPSWHLPIVVIGYLLSFLINVLVYSIYAISFLLAKLTELAKWVYNNIIKHIWNIIVLISTMIWDVVIMLVNIFIEYLIKIPISILIKVINKVPFTLKWSNYLSTYKIIAISSIFSGLLIFTGYLLGNDLIGKIGSPFVFAIALTWIVGKVSFGNNDNGKKAALFALGVIGIISAIAIIVFSTNQLDQILNWGGPITGILYSPSVFIIVVAIILILTVVFITNAGAIYINQEGNNNNFKQNLKGVINQSFNRSWLFILQPLHALSVSLFIIIIPAFLLYISSSTLSKSIVAPTINNKTNALLKEKDELKIKSNLIDDTEITQADFDKSIEDIKRKNKLEINIEENNRLTSYFNSIMSSGVYYKLKPIMTFKAIDNKIDALKENKSKTEKEKTTMIKVVQNNIQSQLSYFGSENESIKKLQMMKPRVEKYYNTQISCIDEQIAQESSNKNWYSMTYFFIIIGSGLLFSFLLSLFANIYAASVLPVYEMWKSSYIVNKFSESKAKNEHQPWVGLILLGTMFFILVLTGSIKGFIKNKLNNRNSNIENMQNSEVENTMNTPIDNNEYSDAPEVNTAIESSYDQQSDQDYSSEQEKQDSYLSEPQND